MRRNRLFLLIPFLAVTLLALWPGAYTVRAARPAPPADNPSLGKAIFSVKCAECHGTEGKGDGLAAPLLTPRPRDLTSGKFKFRSTESGSIPTDEDLLKTILNGLHGTAMPDLRPFLRGDSLQALLAYVKTLSPRFQNETPQLVKPGKSVASSPASIAAGEKVYGKLECASCHGSDGTGKDAIATDLQDDLGHDIKTANLTEPWTFRGGSAPEDIYLRFRTGIDGSPMPSYAGTASEQEMRDLANYVASLGRKPVWSMNADELKAWYAADDDRAKRNPVEHGKRLVNTIGCAFCHTPLREDESIVEELRLAGGQRWNIYPFTEVVSYNLTSDKETGLGNWTDEELMTFLTKGIRRDGSRMLPYPMPWPAFATMKEEDLRAIIAYLRTIPPVYNKIPDPKSPNIFSYLWGKFQMLILKKDIPLRVYPGNAGSAKTQALSENLAPAHAPSREEVRP